MPFALIPVAIVFAISSLIVFNSNQKSSEGASNAIAEFIEESFETLKFGVALIASCISGSKEDVNCDIEEMTNAVANSSIGNSASRLCDIINTTQNDIISSAVDKCWAPEVSGPSIEVFPAHNDEGIIITDIPVTEVPSITILDTPAMVEQPNNVEVFPEQRVDVPIIIDFPAEKQNETGNIIFIDGVSEAENILKKGYDPILADKSIAARDAKVAEIQAKSKSQQQKYITVVGGYNIETGEVAVGVKNTATDYKKCAENLVVEQLGGDPSKVIMTPAIRPRNNATIPVCKYCQEKYSTSNFIPGTTFGGD